MTLLPILLFCLNTLAAKNDTVTQEPTYLAVQIPFYIKDIESMSYITLSKWLFGMIEACIILVCFLHFPFLDGLKRVILAGWGIFLLTNHILTFEFFQKIDFIFWVISVLVGLISALLSLSSGHEHMFFATGAVYSLTYFVILLFRITNGFVALVFFFIFLGGFFLLHKMNRQLHFATAKAAIVSITFIALLQGCFPFTPLTRLHTMGKVNYTLGIYGLILYCIVFALSLVVTIWFEKVTEKYHEVKGDKNEV